MRCLYERSIRYPSYLRLLLSVCATLMVAIMVSTWLPSFAVAGGIRPCERPEVFRNAAVNTVVFPYTWTDNTLSQTAAELSLLIQTESLLSMVKYGDIGVTYLFGKRCLGNEEEITEKLISSMRPGLGLVVIWGRIYEEGSDIYIQSYMRIIRKDTTERISWRGPQPGSQFEFSGRLPSQTFAFAPRRLTKGDLHDIEAEFQKSAIVHEYPSDKAKGKPIDILQEIARDPFKPFAYQVEEVRGDWIHISGFGFGGWIRARAAGRPLNQKMPELSFLDAAVGYLRLRIAKDVAFHTAPLQTAGWIKDSFQRFEVDSGPGQAALPVAMGKLMNGTAQVMGADASDKMEAMGRAGLLYSEAAAMIPYSADARNLEIMSRIYLCCRNGESEAMDIIEDLLKAVAVESRNDDVLGNLENFYEFLISITARSSEFTGSTNSSKADDLAKRLEALREVRSALRKPSDNSLKAVGSVLQKL